MLWFSLWISNRRCVSLVNFFTLKCIVFLRCMIRWKLSCFRHHWIKLSIWIVLHFFELWFSSNFTGFLYVNFWPYDLKNLLCSFLAFVHLHLHPHSLVRNTMRISCSYFCAPTYSASLKVWIWHFLEEVIHELSSERMLTLQSRLLIQRQICAILEFNYKE